MTCRELQKQFPSINPAEVELICAHVLKCSREHVIAHPDLVIRRLKDYKIKRLLKKRERGIPLAYVTGHKEFYGLDFVVNKHVLVPRPDTEILVETVLNTIKNQKSKIINLIDVGTGTGCIPIVILDQIRKWGLPASLKLWRSGSVICKSYATDISKKTLKVAKKNAKTHNVDITFFHGNLLEPIIKSKIINHKSKIIITANLPYLTAEQFQNEPSIHHEPKHALVADNNGLALYDKFFKQIQLLLSTFNFLLSTFIEINPQQTSEITDLIKSYLPNSTIYVHKDLAGHDRVVEIECTGV